TSGSLAVAVDTLSAGGDVNLQLLQGVRESSLPSSPPSYSLNVQENANASPTVVTKHFREDGTGPSLVLDLGAFGITTTTSPTAATTYPFNSAQAAGNINVTGPTTLDVTLAGGLTTTASGNITLTHLNGSNLQLTGGTGDNLFSLNDWSGSTTIHDASGSNKLTLNQFSGTVTAQDVLTLVNPVVTKTSSVSSFLNGKIAVDNDTRFIIDDGTAANDLVVAAVLSGTNILRKQGTGTLVL